MKRVFLMGIFLAGFSAWLDIYNYYHGRGSYIICFLSGNGIGCRQYYVQRVPYIDLKKKTPKEREG